MTNQDKYDTMKKTFERRIEVMKRCFIVGSGDITSRDLTVGENDFVIAADGGYLHLEKIGVKPDLLVGDFDSLGFTPDDIPIYRFPAEKDDTDMGLAVQKGIAMGGAEFILYAGSGSRPDHFYANLQLLNRYSEMGYKIRMVCPKFNVYALCEGEIGLCKDPKTVFSVFSLSDSCTGVSITNAKYEIENADLSNRFPLGVSNEFIGKTCTISIKKGVLLIFEYLSPEDN